MNKDDAQFEAHVNSIRFDDTPSPAHRQQLEAQLLAAWDNRDAADNADGDAVEPTGLYLRKMAIAASFLIVCGLLFYGIDRLFIGEQSYRGRGPERAAVERILEAENVTGPAKKQLLAQIQEVWALIAARDADGLVAVLEANDRTSYALRRWAASHLGDFGGPQTLAVLEATIDHLAVTDPEDPLMVATEAIRRRLGMPPRPRAERPAANGGIEAAETDVCRPAGD